MAQNKVMLLTPLNAAQLWDWSRQQRVDALPSKRQAAFHSLEWTTPQTYSACKLNTQRGCRESPMFSWEDLKNSPELTNHDMHCRKMEASRTCGTSMMVASCVTRSWCRLTCMNLTMPMRKLEQKKTTENGSLSLRGRLGRSTS